jgi:hypothetical protein
MARGFSAIQNNSDLSQGRSPPSEAESTERAAGILMPLLAVKIAAIPSLIANTEKCHEHVGHAICGGTGHGRAQPISLA